jgi:hypothetical protein
VFQRTENGNWNLSPVQIVPIPFGNNLNWIELSEDESRVLLCVQNFLYEYSFIDGKLNNELFRINSRYGVAFASYWYNERGERKGILYADGEMIVLLDAHYKEVMRLNSGNGISYYITPLLIDEDYRFSWQSSFHRGVREKYYIHMRHEVQEFDADTNTCSRIFQVNGRTMLGYCLNNQIVRLFFKNMRSINIMTSEIDDTSKGEAVFIEYEELRDSVSFSTLNIGKPSIMSTTNQKTPHSCRV